MQSTGRMERSRTRWQENVWRDAETFFGGGGGGFGKRPQATLLEKVNTWSGVQHIGEGRKDEVYL